ncbi:hypothetical protein MLD38_022910 [Melastoma candidum]|uniref:Uncharacterized protein n=1 Tax=Melastoma candidum TaxID=119954 RepID=A0ACB9QL06_9MYRT|nr:hypothetical protein MLD38_022910 [Melastoma candidum]
MANNPQYSGFQHLRPPMVGSTLDPPRSFVERIPAQPWPLVPQQPSMQFPSSLPPQFQPPRVAPPLNVGMQQQLHYPPVQPVPPRPLQPMPNLLPPPPPPLPIGPRNRSIGPESILPQPRAVAPGNFAPAVGGIAPPLPSSSFTFISQGGLQQMNPPPRPSTQFHPVSQPPPLNPTMWEQVQVPEEPVKAASDVAIQPKSVQPSESPSAANGVTVRPYLPEGVQTDWSEHVSPKGKRYYYNNKTKISSWTKPFELMTAAERADATTDWSEHRSPDGLPYYYNKVTKQSKWKLPPDLKAARELAGLATESLHLASPPPVATKKSHKESSSATSQEIASTPALPLHVDGGQHLESALPSEPGALSTDLSTEISNHVGGKAPSDDSKQASVVEAGSDIVVDIVDNYPVPVGGNSKSEEVPSTNEVLAEDKRPAMAELSEEHPSKNVDDKANELLQYANKQDAKTAFMELLESANIGDDWTWERAMRAIINDKRYGALKNLGERKEAFSEYLDQRKKHEAIKYEKSREEFIKMLEESKIMTSSSRWSKAVDLFKDDERFRAVEGESERKDLFKKFTVELEVKERERAVEERKRNLKEYKLFLESCNFIKASTQWRKVQNRLEADERCSRLDKADRIDIFQEHLHELDLLEAEQMKIQKEELRKVERKNRDEFRKLLEEHVSSGNINALTEWRDFYDKVKGLPTYGAVASNTSGATPHDLFVDITEELRKQYEDDKAHIKDALKLRKLSVTSSWTIEDLKTSIASDLRGQPVSDINLSLALEAMMEKVKKKEREDKKHKHLAGDKFFNLLKSIREISSSSTWEQCRSLVQSSDEYYSIRDEGYCQKIFEEYLTKLKEREMKRRTKEEKLDSERYSSRERRDESDKKRSRKDRRERESYEREKWDYEEDVAGSDSGWISDSHASHEKKRSRRDRDRRQVRHHHHDGIDDADSDLPRKSHRFGGDHRKDKQLSSSSDSELEEHHKKLGKDLGIDYRSWDEEELEDGEVKQE